MILCTSVVSEAYHVTDVIYFSVNVSLTHTHTHSLLFSSISREVNVWDSPVSQFFRAGQPTHPQVSTQVDIHAAETVILSCRLHFPPKYSVLFQNLYYRETVIAA